MSPTAGRPAEPCVMTIFGASGDLTKRKLTPALYNLEREGLLSPDFAVVGFARREMSDDAFRQKMAADVAELSSHPIDAEVWQRLESRLYYCSGEFGDPAAYERLKSRIEELGERHGARGNAFFYLATSPSFFSGIVEQLGACGLSDESESVWRRVIIEKPFGRDYESARRLNLELSKTLAEHQIYRIDHYLGKETVQNIMVFRFANGIFEPLWNHRYIDHVQITVAESLGVEGRGGYYDRAGAMRDMVPNHIFQLISLITMEPPISFDADAVRDEQAKALRSLQPMTNQEVLSHAIRGQYGPGGEGLSGYRQEPGVPPDSHTETYVALKLTLDNWRWAGVAIYLRTGKRLPVRGTEIVIQFSKAPFTLFRHTDVERLPPSRLVLRLQPDEGISLSFGAKVPGAVVSLDEVHMDFKYADYFGRKPSTGYERLLYDCMLGDATLFQRADMTESSWQIVAPVLDLWNALPAREFPNYEAGGWGPRAAEDLLARDGRQWVSCGAL